jgi:hypothetical protein
MTQLVSTGIDANGIEDFVGVDADGKFILKRTCHDVEPVLDSNKRLAASGDGYSPSRDLRRVASIPIGVVEMWKAIYGVDPLSRGQERLLTRLLNDPEWAWLRTAPGRVDFKEAT